MADKRVKRQASGIGWAVDGQIDKVFRTRAEARKWDRAKQKAIKAGLARAVVVATLEPVPQEKTITHSITLATGEVVEIGYTISRIGQQKAIYGDAVLVGAVIFLPADSGGYLHPEFVFHDRLAQSGFLYLPWDWGFRVPEKKRVERPFPATFQATTWRRAFWQADEAAKEVIQAIMQAVEARREALKAAEE